MSWNIHVIVSLLFGAGVVYNLCQTPKDWANIGLGLGIVVCMTAMFFWLRRRSARCQETLRWLRNHQQLITDEARCFETSPFPDRPISGWTTMRSFRAVTSLIVPTALHELGDDLRGSVRRGKVATVWTLIFGSWALPRGPLRTIQALAVNLTGGEKEAVRQAIHAAERAERAESGERS